MQLSTETLFRDFFSDPVLFISFGFLALVLIICGYFTYFFLKNIADDPKS